MGRESFRASVWPELIRLLPENLIDYIFYIPVGSTLLENSLPENISEVLWVHPASLSR
jgi:hypothetical protein